MKPVYIAHPLGSGSDREPNRQRAERWVLTPRGKLAYQALQHLGFQP